MSANSAPFAIGDTGFAAFGEVYETNLGRQWMINGAYWRLLRSAGAFPAPGRDVFITGIAGGLPTYEAALTVTPSALTPVGVAHASQRPLTAGDYFLGQTSGYGEVISAAAIVAGAALGTSATSGAAATSAVLGAQFAVALEAAAAAGEFVGVKFMKMC